MPTVSKIFFSLSLCLLFGSLACGSGKDGGGTVIDRPDPPENIVLELKPKHDGHIEFHTESEITIVEDSNELLISQFYDSHKRRAFIQFEILDSNGTRIRLDRILSIKLKMKKNPSEEMNPRPMRLFLLEEDYLVNGFTESDFDSPVELMLGVLDDGGLIFEKADLEMISSNTLSLLLKVDNEVDQSYDVPYSFKSMESEPDGPKLIVKFSPESL